ncbi:MAG TPA: helix-turn-helix domain-containing protein [Nitrososphaerales archaeon]|nr:helix-turn-helix domain-containing protein [Nitrososphaerales archaeon]
MIHPYEIVSKSALPAFRAMVSKRLTENFNMTQQEVATRLGVTQASVSNYARKARGMMLDLEIDENIAKAADRVAELLASERPDQREALRLMTEVCDYIRFNHTLCALHEELEPGFRTEGCFACLGSLPPESGTIRLTT